MSAEIKHLTIKNIDVPVVFEQNDALPTFNLQLVFTNSGYIKDGKLSGLANLSSKLLNEGTKKDGSVKFAEKLDENAISLSASNGFETFVIELSSLKEVNSKALLMLKKLLNDPNYSKETLNKLKTIQIGSLKRKENDFDDLAKKELKKLLFKGTALKNTSSGTVKSVQKIELDDIKTFLEQALTLENLIVVAGGDIDYDSFTNLIAPLLNEFKKGKATALENLEANDLAQKEILKRETQQAYIYFGSPFEVTVDDKERYKAKVASFILGGSGFGSRLMEEIRVKRGLAYSAYGFISNNKTHAYFMGYLQTKNENAKEAQKLVQELVDLFVKDGVTQEELDAAKRFLMGSEPLRVETLSQRLNRSFMYYYQGLKQNYAQKELELIENLTLEDLNSYIKSHKEIKKLSFSIVRN